MLKVLLALVVCSQANANPYSDSSKVPTDSSYVLLASGAFDARKVKNVRGLSALRIGVKVDLARERYALASKVREFSGTQALMNRAHLSSKLGSYRAVVKDLATGKVIGHDSIGTGKEYRKLVDMISFRFPMPAADFSVEVTAENPVTGVIEAVLTENVSLASVSEAPPVEVEVFELNQPRGKNSLRIGIYAEGYKADRKRVFLESAKKVAEALVVNKIPGAERMHFFAVFAPSTEKLGPATDLGFPIPERKTFLGMHYPYWSDFGRWYHVLYPTREEKLRRGLAAAPYDYPIILADESSYWGVGNFRAFTAIPGGSPHLVYLLLHEIGHFFGLNEEYEDGGRTELEFAPGIFEPWSQNITFLRDKRSLKWAEFVSKDTLVPTPVSDWKSDPPSHGAYVGGYAESEPLNHSHKPGLNCVMDRYQDFCDVCKKAISDVVAHDLGEAKELRLSLKSRNRK